MKPSFQVCPPGFIQADVLSSTVLVNASDYLNLSQDPNIQIEDVKFILPKIGSRSFGKFRITYVPKINFEPAA